MAKNLGQGRRERTCTMDVLVVAGPGMSWLINFQERRQRDQYCPLDNDGSGPLANDRCLPLPVSGIWVRGGRSDERRQAASCSANLRDSQPGKKIPPIGDESTDRDRSRCPHGMGGTEGRAPSVISSLQVLVPCCAVLEGHLPWQAGDVRRPSCEVLGSTRVTPGSARGTQSTC